MHKSHLYLLFVLQLTQFALYFLNSLLTSNIYLTYSLVRQCFCLCAWLCSFPFVHHLLCTSCVLLQKLYVSMALLCFMCSKCKIVCSKSMHKNNAKLCLLLLATQLQSHALRQHMHTMDVEIAPSLTEFFWGNLSTKIIKLTTCENCILVKSGFTKKCKLQRFIHINIWYFYQQIKVNLI